MLKNQIQKFFPHIIAILIFLIIASIYSRPVLEGKKLQSSDFMIYKAISKANNDYEEENDRLVFWNNSMFSGMPTYAVTTAKQENIFFKIYNNLIFGDSIPLNLIFWYLLGFYIFLCTLRIDRWLSVLGAIAFGFSSYFFIILVPGHFTKAIAIGFMAPIIGGVLLAFNRKKPWAGMLLMTFFLSLQILSNHVQITYYTGMMVLFYGIFELVFAIKEKYLLRFTKTVGILLIGVILAIGINAAFILTTKEYIKYSIRGESELSTAQHDRTKGVDKSYATDWSYGIDETFTLLVPNAKGGASYSELDENSATFNVLESIFGKQQTKDIIKGSPTYFGDQPGTSGPVYVGAFVFFLFIFGLLVVKGRMKWWLLSVTILSIILAWGKNFDIATNLFLDYFPAYSKFRTVTMILVLAEFCIPLLGILALVEIFKEKVDTKVLLKKLYLALGITGLLTLIFIISPSIFGIQGEEQNEINRAEFYASSFPNDPQYDQAKQDFKESYVNAIHEDRVDLVRKDATRSLIYILLGALVIFLIIKKKINPKLAIIAMGIIVIADMWTINTRYLNEDNYVPKRKYETPFEKTPVDNFILQDSDPHYRVCDISASPYSVFSDGSTSFYHKSIGGYSGAKVRRYQEMYDSIMLMEILGSDYLVRVGYQNGFDANQVQELFEAEGITPIINMLNTKYIIYSKTSQPLINNNALGNAWFISDITLVENANEEIVTLKTIDPSYQAVVAKEFQSAIDGFKPAFDSTATIKLTDVAPDYVVYESNTKSEQLALFSEVYYPHGWVVTIDGEEVDYFRANYILRAMRVPAGKHTIKFSFEPKIYTTGVAISYASSAIYFLLLFGLIFLEYRKRKTLKEE